MTSLFTNASIDLVHLFAAARTFTIMGIILLVVLLAQKEIANTLPPEKGQRLKLILNVAIVPLFTIFVLLVSIKLIEALG